MERTKKTVKEPAVPAAKAIKWVNKGGNFRLASGEVIVRGKTFTATPDQIPTAFRDIIKPVDEVAARAAETVEVVPIVYTTKAREDGKFDILDSRGKIVNERPLTEPEANEVLVRLNE